LPGSRPRVGSLGLQRAGSAARSFRIDPIKALFWSAVINGVVAVPVMVMMMHMSSHRKIMGDFTLSPALKIAGWLATAVMAAAAVGMFVTMAMGGGV
jgi:Mn2+/Fe2+ NRAMP family transporter